MRWREAGLDRLEERLEFIDCTQPDPHTARVTVKSVLAPRPNTEGEVSTRFAETLEQLAGMLNMGVPEDARAWASPRGWASITPSCPPKASWARPARWSGRWPNARPCPG